MDASVKNKLENLKQAVRRTVIESHEANPYDLGAWTSVSRFLYYVLDMTPESLQYARLHTEIFNGEPVSKILFSNDVPGADFINTYSYADLIEGIPEDLILEEPNLPPFTHPLFSQHPHPQHGNAIPIGQPVYGRQLTPDLMRYQAYMRNFHNLGLIAQMQNATPDDRYIFLEIGTGFGCLQYQLLSRFKGKMSAVVIDLPLMLIFTGAYLLANIPDLNVYIYDPEKPEEKPDPAVHDLILLPNYRVEYLEGLEKIDLAFNSISMQEMSTPQIIDYLDFIQNKLSGVFYYHGLMTIYEGQDPALIDGIVKEVSDRFDIRPSLNFFRNTTEKYMKSPTVVWPVSLPYQFIATSRDGAYTLPADPTIRVTLADHRQVDVTLSGNYASDEENPREAYVVKVQPSLARRILRKIRRMIKA